jgi:hypothetical protein
LAGPRGHAVPEAMVLGPLAGVGLERALHEASSLRNRGGTARQMRRRVRARAKGRAGAPAAATGPPDPISMGHLTPCAPAGGRWYRAPSTSLKDHRSRRVVTSLFHSCGCSCGLRRR